MNNLVTHINSFQEKAELVHRQQAESNHKQTMAVLTLVDSHDLIEATEFPLHTVNLRRNAMFTGRDEALKSLNEYVTGGDFRAEPKSCVIHGIGGVGKTQTALEYTYRYRSSYDCIFWLRAETAIELLKSYGAIGRKLGLCKTEGINQTTLERIQAWLEKSGNSLRDLNMS